MRSCALLVLLLAALPSTARGQACQVAQGKAVTLLPVPTGKKCGDSGVTCASTVRVAMDPSTSLPVVLWYGDDKKLRLRRLSGAAWAAADVVPAGVTLPSNAVATLEAAAHALDKAGTVYVVASDGKKVYLTSRKAAAKTWSAPAVIHTITKTKLTGLKVFASVDATGRLHVVYWYESGIGFIYHGLRQAGSSQWTWTQLGGGRHIDVAFAPSGAVHVSWVRKLSKDPANWQAYHRRRDAAGAWLKEEKVTSETPVSQTIGPVAIHPAVAMDVKGGAHMIYPVDPPDDKGDDAGHARYTQRGAGGWSKPQTLFSNARHSAMLKLVLDSAGVTYAFGLNLKCRLATRAPGGAWKTGTWHSHKGGYRFFFFDGISGNSGAWLAYTVGREWGPVEVIHLRRTGACACEKQGGCTSGQQQKQSCGTCGTRTRTCGGYCNWSPWSPCKECPGADGGGAPNDAALPPQDGAATITEAGAPDSRADSSPGQPQLSGGCSCDGGGCECTAGAGAGGAWPVIVLLLCLGVAAAARQISESRPRGGAFNRYLRGPSDKDHE